ncbi:MAG: acetate kinase [Propionibacteriaceae bacterium]
MAESVLVINSGSSSLKYQVVDPGSGVIHAKGLVERIGESGTSPAVPDHRAAMALMADQLSAAGVDLRATVSAVGHRVVHGGARFSQPTVIADDVVEEIEQLSSLAPLHNPPAVAGIRAAQQLLPDVAHVAVFDTAFFATLPEPARTYAIPTEIIQKLGIRRYGFHGTSHGYVSRLTAATLDRPYGELHQIVLHLGNGCSASAIRGGVAVETSMGLTPLQGLVMGTRSGDVDPGLHGFLASTMGLSASDIDTLLNQQSGLKGLAGVNDFRQLEERRAAGDEAAALAFAVYVHRIRCYLGAYLVVLGSLDALTFTAGVGENNPALRAAITADLQGLGIELDADANAARSGEPRVVSTAGSRTTVLVVPTNEELAIARLTAELV